MMKKIMSSILAACMFAVPVMARNVVWEFKGAYFLPTNDTFTDIYGHGSALFGPEVTFQLCDNEHWYGFASFDYFQKKGKSLGLCEPTRIRLLPLAAGLKYLHAFREKVHFYVGLGFEPVFASFTNCSDSVEVQQKEWGVGAIAKVGAYYDLPHDFVLDFFVDYSYAKVGSDSICGCDETGGVVSTKANVSGVIFGLGLGYHFS